MRIHGNCILNVGRESVKCRTIAGYVVSLVQNFDKYKDTTNLQYIYVVFFLAGCDGSAGKETMGASTTSLVMESFTRGEISLIESCHMIT